MAKPVTLTAVQIAQLAERAELQRQIDALSDKELTIRKSLIASGLFSTLDSKEEGQQTIQIANYPGWTITAKKLKNYNLTNKKGETQIALEQLANVNPAAAQNMVTWKPVIAEGAFRKLAPEQKEMFTAALTITPGTPQLELNPPTEAFLKEQAEANGIANTEHS